jgi:S1-C subfamily serine protease
MTKVRNTARDLALLLLLALSLGGTTGSSQALEPARTAALVGERVVLITGYMGRDSDEPFVTASGYIVEDEYVISVNNVFTDGTGRRLCERFRLRLQDGREIEGRVHSVDPVLNLIVLKATQPFGHIPPEAVSNTAKAGDKVLALAGGGSLSSVPYSMGYVKARHKTSVYGAGLGDMFIDSRIRLPPYGDGGPLLNDSGKIIGLNTPNIHRPDSEEGDPEEAHALPIRVVKSFFKIANEFPTSKQSWMGLAFRPLSPEEKMNAYQILGRSAGVMIEYVWADGPAGESDIATGDVLVSVNGRTLQHLHELERMLFELEPGNTAELAVLRQDRGLFRQIALEERPAWAGHVKWQIPQEVAGNGHRQAADPRL